MKASSLFVAIVRSGGLLIFVWAVAELAAFGSWALLEPPLTVVSNILAPVGVVLVFGALLIKFAPGLARRFRWPDERPAPTGSRGDSIDWRVGARVVAVIAIVLAIDPVAALLDSLFQGQGRSYWLSSLVQAAAYGLCAT